MKYPIAFFFMATALSGAVFSADDFPKPYSPPCVERENVFEFTEKPVCKYLGDDKFEITFAVKGFCDVTVAIVDPDPGKELVKGQAWWCGIWQAACWVPMRRHRFKRIH